MRPTQERKYNMFELGKMARDKVTGFEGMITGHAKHLYGCDTYWLDPKVDKEGKTQSGHWFDEGRIEIIGEGIKPKDVRVAKNGAGELASPYNKN